MSGISFNAAAAADVQHQQQAEESAWDMTRPACSLLQCTAQRWTVTLLGSSLVLLLDDGDPCWLPANTCCHPDAMHISSSEIVRLSECSTWLRPWYHWRTWAQLGIQCTHACAWISCLHPCPSPPGMA